MIIISRAEQGTCTLLYDCKLGFKCGFQWINFAMDFYY